MLDAFNIFDLFIEVWRNLRWLFLAVILRRPYIRNPESERFNIYDAMRGERQVESVYGRVGTYAKLDRPGDAGQAEDGMPMSLLPRKHQQEQEPDLSETEYSHTYGRSDKV